MTPHFQVVYDKEDKSLNLRVNGKPSGTYITEAGISSKIKWAIEDMLKMAFELGQQSQVKYTVDQLSKMIKKSRP